MRAVARWFRENYLRYLVLTLTCVTIYMAPFAMLILAGVVGFISLGFLGSTYRPDKDKKTGKPLN